MEGTFMAKTNPGLDHNLVAHFYSTEEGVKRASYH